MIQKILIPFSVLWLSSCSCGCDQSDDRKAGYEKGQNFLIFDPKYFRYNKIILIVRTTNLLENMQKNFDGLILNKNTSQKNPRGRTVICLGLN